MKVRDRGIPWTIYGLVLVIGLFVVAKFGYLSPRFSDGNIYLFLSQLISQGLVPYQDFFYSSPPFILYLLAAYGSIFGFSWQSFVYIPIILTSIDAVLIFWLIRRYGSSLGALSGAAVYILSYTTLATTDFVTDVHIIATLVLLGVVASEKKLPILSGAFFALAVLSKLYAVVLVVGWVARYIWLRKQSELIKFSISFIAITGAVSLGMYLVSGKEFYDLVILSHFGKIQGLSKGDIATLFSQRDWLLILAPIVWLATSKKTPSVVVIPIIALAIFYTAWNDIYYLYLKLFVVWMALLWGWIITDLGKKLSNNHYFITVIIFVLLLSGFLNTKVYSSNQAEVAVIYPLDEVVNYVIKNTNEEDEVYGAFEITPLVALEANRKIWKNMADTNIKFFQTGWFDHKERERQIKQDKVPLIITKALFVRGDRLSRGPEEVLPRSFFNENCRMAKVWPVEKDYLHNAVIVWQCDY